MLSNWYKKAAEDWDPFLSEWGESPPRIISDIVKTMEEQRLLKWNQETIAHNQAVINKLPDGSLRSVDKLIPQTPPSGTRIPRIQNYNREYDHFWLELDNNREYDHFWLELDNNRTILCHEGKEIVVDAGNSKEKTIKLLIKLGALLKRVARKYSQMPVANKDSHLRVLRDAVLIRLDFLFNDITKHLMENILSGEMDFDEDMVRQKIESEMIWMTPIANKLMDVAGEENPDVESFMSFMDEKVREETHRRQEQKRLNEQAEEEKRKLHPLDGLSGQQVSNKVNKVIRNYLDSLHKTLFDNPDDITRSNFIIWTPAPVLGVIDALRSANMPAEVITTRQDYTEGASPVPLRKWWQLKINYLSKGDVPKTRTVYVSITAAGAGTVAKPLERYDIVAYAS